MENDNYNTGGTGAALFAGKSADAANGQVQTHFTSPNLTTALKIFVCPSPYFFLTDIYQTIGDEYKAPVGLPEWKQPSFDDDDRVDGAQQPFKPTVTDSESNGDNTDFSSRVSGARSESSRTRCTLPKHFTSSSSEPLAPSSPCWPSTSRSHPHVLHPLEAHLFQLKLDQPGSRNGCRPMWIPDRSETHR